MTMTRTVRAAARDEQIVYADLDPNLRARAKFMIDSAGHYARPDVAHLVLHDPLPRSVEVDRGD